MRMLGWLVVGVLVAAAPAPAASFTEDALSRWPHLQRHWLQLQNKRVTTPVPAAAAAVTVSGESHEAVERDDRAATTAPSEPLVTEPDEPGAATKSSPASTPGPLTIAQAKEKLRARRIKSRKRIDQMQQELELYQQHKKMETSTSVPATSTPGMRESTAEVKKHIQMMMGATCSRPAARLVYVKDEYQTMANVRYLPGCTWLHRCSDAVGCCPDESKTCSPSHIESVSLPFFVLTMTGQETKRSVARLTFDNHTACECVGRNSDLMPRTQPIVEQQQHQPAGNPLKRDAGNKKASHRVRPEHQLASDDPSVAGHDKARLHHAQPAGHGAADGRRRNRRRHQRRRRLAHHHDNAKCPADYSSAPVGGKLHCVCQASTRRCDRLKRGLLPFAAHDRRCINETRCRLPGCDYGRYVTLLGRCPRRDERLA